MVRGNNPIAESDEHAAPLAFRHTGKRHGDHVGDTGFIRYHELVTLAGYVWV